MDPVDYGAADAYECGEYEPQFDWVDLPEITV